MATEHMGETGATVLDRLMRGRDRDRERLSADVRQAGGPAVWVASKTPQVCSLGPPKNLAEEDITAETTAFWEDAEKRIAACKRCPPHGGACEGQLLCIADGLLLKWKKKRLVTAKCVRWREHQIRQRLIDSGVPPAAAHYQIDVNDLDELEHKVVGFVLNAYNPQHDGASTMVLHGSSQTGKTSLAISALREFKLRQDRPVWYVTCDKLKRDLKTSYEYSEEEDPLDRLSSYHLVVIDNLDMKRHAKDWFREALQDVLMTRMSEKLYTMLVSSHDERELQRHFPQVASEFGNAAYVELV